MIICMHRSCLFCVALEPVLTVVWSRLDACDDMTFVVQ